MADTSITEALAPTMSILRRGNPDMGGPTPTDRRSAEKVAAALGIDPDMKLSELRAALAIYQAIQRCERVTMRPDMVQSELIVAAAHNGLLDALRAAGSEQ